MPYNQASRKGPLDLVITCGTVVRHRERADEVLAAHARAVYEDLGRDGPDPLSAGAMRFDAMLMWCGVMRCDGPDRLPAGIYYTTPSIVKSDSSSQSIITVTPPPDARSDPPGRFPCEFWV